MMSTHFEGLRHFMSHNQGQSDPKKLLFSLIFFYLLQHCVQDRVDVYNSSFSRKIKILIRSFIPNQIEDPCNKLQGMFCLTAVLRSDRKEVCHAQIRSLNPQPAKHCRQAEPAGNALAFAVQEACLSFTVRRQMKATADRQLLWASRKTCLNWARIRWGTT